MKAKQAGLGARASESPRKWTEVFGRTREKQVYSMRGTRALCSRAFCRCHANPDWVKAVRFLDAAGVTEERFGSGSPANATEYKYAYSFLGGNFTTIGGDYWGGKHGVDVEGIRPLRFLCYGLGLTQPRRSQGEVAIPTLDELKKELAGGGPIKPNAKDALAELLSLPLAGRIAVVSQDLLSCEDRFAAIEAHDLAEALGVPDAHQPTDENWKMIAYAKIRSLEEQAKIKSPLSEFIHELKDYVSEDRAMTLETEVVKLSERSKPGFGFLNVQERKVIEEALARRDLEANLSNGTSSIARYQVAATSGELWFEAEVEDDGTCIRLRTPYDKRDAKFVELENCVTQDW